MMMKKIVCAALVLFLTLSACGEVPPVAVSYTHLDLVEAVEGAAADEEDVRGVDVDELLMRVLAPALGRHACHRALEQLEQRLLHSLARDVAGYRCV